MLVGGLVDVVGLCRVRQVCWGVPDCCGWRGAAAGQFDIPEAVVRVTSAKEPGCVVAPECDVFGGEQGFKPAVAELSNGEESAVVEVWEYVGLPGGEG